MDMKTMKIAVILSVLLSCLMAVRPCTAVSLDPTCYPVCLGACYVMGNDPKQCPEKCLLKCLKAPAVPANRNHTDSHSFCELGCALSLCSNLSAPHNPATKKVEACVNSCSQHRCSANDSRN